jgi:plasmid stabilization system protein ParE
MTYRLLSVARQELADAMEYYEQASPGLGLEFLDEVERTVRRILLQPEAWTRVSENHRRCRMRRFPYGLIYTPDQDALLITAVFHLHRHPDSWKGRR